MSQTQRPGDKPRLPPGTPVFLDVEASGFGRNSYPIEIGVAMENGHTQCFLIEPDPDWTHWDRQAQALHGICRDTLLQHGIAIPIVARALNELLAGKVVYSDAWGNDQGWVALLFYHAGIRQAFRIAHLLELLTEQQLAQWEKRKQAIFKTMDLSRHRASNDAKILQLTYQEVLQAAAAADPG